MIFGWCSLRQRNWRLNSGLKSATIVTDPFPLGFKYKSYWQWHSYQRLRQTRWLRIPIVNFPWLSGAVPRFPSYGIYISQLVRFAKCCTSVLDFHSKNLQISSKLLTQGYRYHKFWKTFGKFFRLYSELLSKFGDISFQEYVSKGISHPDFYGDLVYKLRRVKDTPNFISSGSKIVKLLRRRQHDPLIIKRTIGLVLGPCTALYRPFLKHCTLTNKAGGTIWRAIRPELASRRAEQSLTYSEFTIYIFFYQSLYYKVKLSVLVFDLACRFAPTWIGKLSRHSLTGALMTFPPSALLRHSSKYCHVNVLLSKCCQCTEEGQVAESFTL